MFGGGSTLTIRKYAVSKPRESLIVIVMLYFLISRLNLGAISSYYKTLLVTKAKGCLVEES